MRNIHITKESHNSFGSLVNLGMQLEVIMNEYREARMKRTHKYDFIYNCLPFYARN